MRRKLGNRRSHPRFDIVGDLWGTLQTVMYLPVQNIGPGGALIHSHVALAPDSVHNFTLRGNEPHSDLTSQVRVRHIEPASTPDGEHGFLIGLEFLTMSASLLAHIHMLTAAGV